MSPYYFENDGSWGKWNGETQPIKDERGVDTGVTISPAKNPEEIFVEVRPVRPFDKTAVKANNGQVIYPADKAVLLHGGFDVVDTDLYLGGVIARIIYSERPIE